ncbi:hypothetical protein H6G04_11340 [Calothrix membranacea FACHB-236]|nr:hypothetical protein [Calothrix membranacea FACHB-236]
MITARLRTRALLKVLKKLFPQEEWNSRRLYNDVSKNNDTYRYADTTVTWIAHPDKLIGQHQHLYEITSIRRQDLLNALTHSGVHYDLITGI